MIPKILSQTRTGEAYSIAQQICDQFPEYGINDLYLDQLLSSILETSDQLVRVTKKTKYKSELTAKDQERDYRFRAIYYLVNGYTYHPDQSKSTNAKTLMHLFNHFGLETLNKNFSSESTFIKSILMRLEKATYLQAIQKLSGVSENIELLKEAQNDFTEAQQILFEHEAKEMNEPKATELKLRLFRQINSELIVYLKAMILSNEAVYGDFAGLIGVIISNNNRKVKKRLKKYRKSE